MQTQVASNGILPSTREYFFGAVTRKRVISVDHHSLVMLIKLVNKEKLLIATMNEKVITNCFVRLKLM